MTFYVVRAVAWAPVLAAAILVAGLMELVGRWPHPTWALEGAAVGVLAAGCAWSLDEPAARVVDTAPVSLARRTAARLPATLLLLAVWVAAVLRGDLGEHADVVLLHGVGAVCVALGWTTWRRAHGSATPGNALALVAVPAALAWGLSRLSDWVPLLPYVAAPAGEWRASAAMWTVLGLLGLGLLVAACADSPWWRRVRPRSGGSADGVPGGVADSARGGAVALGERVAP